MKTLLAMLVVGQAFAQKANLPSDRSWDVSDAGPVAEAGPETPLEDLKNAEPPPAPTVVADGGVTAAAPQPMAVQDQGSEVSTEGMLGRHLRGGGLKLKMGSSEAFVTGQFSRDEKDGFLILHSTRWKNPVYFNLKGLLDNEIEISIGGVSYKLSLDISLQGRMSSHIKIKPGNGDAPFTCTLGQIFETTHDNGQKMTVGGVEQRIFQYNEVAGELQAATNGKRTYTLLGRDKKDLEMYYPYPIPEEELPTDGSERTFKFKGKPMKALAVRLKDGKLQIRQTE